MRSLGTETPAPLVRCCACCMDRNPFQHIANAVVRHALEQVSKYIGYCAKKRSAIPETPSWNNSQCSYHPRVNLAIVENDMVFIKVVGRRCHRISEMLTRHEQPANAGVKYLWRRCFRTGSLSNHSSYGMWRSTLIDPGDGCAYLDFYIRGVIASRATRGPRRWQYDINGKRF